MEEEKKSKTQAKKEMHDLQKLGERLSELSASQIDGMPVPDKLKEALHFVKTIKSHGARSRQMQYIGALMRDVDMEPVQTSLGLIQSGHKIDVAAFLETEKLRDRLLEDNKDALEEVVTRFPEIDRQHLNQLVRNARKESDQNKPPKSKKALFRYLKDFVDNENSIR